MLAAQLGQNFGCQASPSGSYALVALANACGSFLRVLTLSFEIGRQCVVKGRSGVLSVTLCVFFQLGEALGFQWDHIHSKSGPN